MVYASVYVLMLFGVHFGAVRCTLLTFLATSIFACTPLIRNYIPRTPLIKNVHL